MSAALRRIRIDLAYDGTGYSGWQLQAGAPTVQGVVEGALSRIEGDRAVTTRSAGRTDAGVHARGQVADALVNVRRDDDEILRGLKALLPSDVRPMRVLTAAPKFHPRHSAVVKTYRYLVDGSPAGDPFLARFALHHPRALDLGAIAKALALLPGERDFSGFTASHCELEDRVRNLTEARLVHGPGGLLAFVFSADGFLTHMVRNIVGTMLDIGTGRLPIECVEAMLATHDRGLGGAKAPAHGLCLERVVYADGPPSGVAAAWPIVE